MASFSPFRIGPRRVPPLRGSLAAYSLTRVIRSSAHKGEAAPHAAGWRCQECVLPGFGQGRKTEQITLSAGANAEMLAIDFLSSGFQGKFIRRFITYQSFSGSVKRKISPFSLCCHHACRNLSAVKMCFAYSLRGNTRPSSPAFKHCFSLIFSLIVFQSDFVNVLQVTNGTSILISNASQF